MIIMSLELFEKLNEITITKREYLFIGTVLALIWIYLYFFYTSFDKEYGQIYLNLLYLIFGVYAILGIFSVNSLISKGRIHAFPLSMSVSRQDVILLVGASIASGFIFSYFTFSFVPLHVFDVAMPPAYLIIQNFASKLQILMNYAVIPAILEEFFVFAIMIITALFIASISKGKTLDWKGVFVVYLIITFSFTVFHYNHYSHDLISQYNSYQQDPSGWRALHPNMPIPVNPQSFSFFWALIVALAGASIFRIANTSLGILLGSGLLSINIHYLSNAFRLVNDQLSPTHNAWLALFFFELVIILLMFVWYNYFTEKTNIASEYMMVSE